MSETQKMYFGPKAKNTASDQYASDGFDHPFFRLLSLSPEYASDQY